MHDYDNNTKLDGLELLKSMTHFHDEHESEHKDEEKKEEGIKSDSFHDVLEHLKSMQVFTCMLFKCSNM